MSKQSQNLSPITLKEFKILPFEAIKISVVRCIPKTFGATTYEISIMLYLDVTYKILVNKRYTEFQGLYETLSCRYKNISLPEFPSKFQLINKEESRIKFFDSLLNTIINLAKNNPETKKAFLTIIYDFLLDDPNKEVKVIRKDQDTLSQKSSTSPLSLNSSFREGNDSKDEKDTPTERRNSYNGGGALINNSATFDELSLDKEGKSPHWNNVYIKIGKDPFFMGYIKITEQSLLIFKNITLSNFVLMVPLYKINFDLYRINRKTNRNHYIESKELFSLSNLNVNLLLEDLDSELLVKLYHTFGMFDLYLRFPQNTSIKSTTAFVNALEQNSFSGKSNSIYMLPIDETNQNIYGNIYLEIKSLSIPDYQGQCFIRIYLDPYQLKTKTTMHNSNFVIKQAFLIPIHNRFNQLKFEVYSAITEGIFKKTTTEEKLCEFSVELPEILNTFFVPTDGINIKMTNENKSIKLNNNNITLNFRVIDYSSLLSLLVKNRNKRILEDMSMEKSDDELGIKNLLKRMKKMIHVFKELNKFYKTVFRFKYPIFSVMIMFFSILFFLNCQTKYLITHIIFLFILIVFSFSKLYRATLGPLFEKYIFSVTNPYDLQSKFLYTIDQKDQEEIMKKDYLIEKADSNIISTIIDPIKNFKEYLRTFKEVVFSFTKFVSTFEKLKNLFLWTDPLLSFYFMVLMVLLMLIVYHIEIRYIFLISFTKKFIFGMFYYKDKHYHNLEIGRILLEYCYDEWKKQLKSNIKSENKDFKTVQIYDEKFKILIKEEFEKHSEILVKDELFNNILTLGDIQQELGKSEMKLKIKRISNLFHFTQKNPRIMKNPIEPEDVFTYFIQNIKSDYYIKRHSLDYDNNPKVQDDRFISLSSDNFNFEKSETSSVVNELIEKDKKNHDAKSKEEVLNKKEQDNQGNDKEVQREIERKKTKEKPKDNNKSKAS